MNVLLLLPGIVVLTIALLEFKFEKKNVQQSASIAALDAKGYLIEEILITSIIIFGLWGILTSLGMYNF